MRNKKVLMIGLAIVLSLAILLGSSYAYLRVEKKSGNQNISIANFGLVIKEDMKAITLNNEVPKSDEEGLKNTPNTFKIENQGDVTAKYKLSLIDSTIQSTMSNLDIRYRVKRTRSTGVETGEVKSLSADGVFDEGIIAPSEEISFELVIWINHDANPNGLTYSKVLSLEGLQADTLDKSGANPPEMLPNMIPVYYSKTSDTEGVWKVADITNRDTNNKWYDYNDFMWANAVTVKETNGTLDEEGNITFDGVDDSYSLGYANYNFKNKISIVARIKLNSTPSTEAGYIVGCTSVNSGGFYFQATKGNYIQFGFFTEDSYQQIASGISIDLNTWYTIVVSYDASYIRLYIFKDNSLIKKIEMECSENINVSKEPLRLGASSGTNRYLNATIKSVYVYTDALTEEEVSKYFSGEITDYPKDNLLVEKTEFNELDARQKYLEASAGTEVKMDDISSMWVWIPRYKYTIFNGNNGTADEQLIDVEFEHGIETTGTVNCQDKILTDDNSTSSEVCTDETNKEIKNGISTYTHPAFKFGEDELVGFWFAKFAMSTDDNACLTNQSTSCNNTNMNILVKPSVTSLRYQDISNMFVNIRRMELTNNIHGFKQSENATSASLTGEITNDSNNYDIHMEKNMEWGAVAYLTMSKYGKYGNGLYKDANKEVYINNYSQVENDITTFKTGYSGKEPITGPSTNGVPYNDLTIGSDGQGYLGAGASTTGTVYGIYDMSGGGHQIVMGNAVNKNGNFNVDYARKWTESNKPLDKYYDKYSYNTKRDTQDSISRSKFGDAIKEVKKKIADGSNNAWFNDVHHVSRSFFIRGGNTPDYSGAGIFYSGEGDANFATKGETYLSPSTITRPVLTITRDFPWQE